MSRRKNSTRTGSPDIAPPPGTSPQNNIGFTFVTPSEFVELPSAGKFYAEDHPLHGSKVIEIKHMTAKEEDILTSEALLKSGLALNRLLQSVIVDKNIDPDSLLIGDKNAVLIAVRQTGFGDIYTTSVACPACGVQNEKDFSLEDKEVTSSDVPEGVTILENGNFIVHDEKYDVNIEVRLLTGRDETKITKTIENKRKFKKETGTVTTMLQNIVVAVNDMRQAAVIEQVTNAMPVDLSRKIRTIYDSVMPNVGIYADFECDSCNHAARLEVPISLNFFWPEL